MLAPHTILQNRYRILSVLGQGGMGAVYLAEDTRLPGRRCAIKENEPDPTTSPQALQQARQQFLTEASILAQLDHPNLPRVSDYFSEGGREYLVMDYVEGKNLQQHLQEHFQRQGRPLPEKPVLIWIQQVLDALEYLHNQRPWPIIHRDIKPANIILTPQGQAKLVDFGLVKLLDPTDPRTATIQRGLGTPGYTPLEQYASGPGHTDARSDIYALGATLYCLLTGQTPADAHQRFADQSALWPPRTLNPAITSHMESVILKALAMQPQDRFQSATEMRAALTMASAPSVYAPPPPLVPPAYMPPTVPVPPVQVSPGAPQRSRAKELRAAVGGVLLGLLLLCALVSGAVWLRGSQATATPVAQRPTDTPVPPTLTPRPTYTPVPPTATPQPSSTPAPTQMPTPTRTPKPSGTPTNIRWPKDGKEMVLVPAGEFPMGTSDAQLEVLLRENSLWERQTFDNEKPQHWVYLDAFYMDKTEVTNAEYKRFVDATGHRVPYVDEDWARPYNWVNNTYPAGLANYPVILVNWDDAAAYCQWAGKRLPTEAEWEKAARGTDERVWPWGNTLDGSKLNLCDRNCEDIDWGERNKNLDDGYARIAPVGSYPTGASPYGCLDMAGNVWEWCADWFDEHYYANSPARNPTGPASSSWGWRVLRGGSWYRSRKMTRAANRYANPDGRYLDVGFRCCLSATAAFQVLGAGSP